MKNRVHEGDCLCGGVRQRAAGPARSSSSPAVLRGFCPTCGTSLSYRHEARPGEIDLTLASLDDPGQLHPECRI